MKYLKLFEDSDNVNDRIFMSLIRNNKLDKALEYLKNNSDIDPSQERNFAIKTIAGENDIEFAKYLLADKRVDPAAHYNSSITIASREGNIEMVKLLLTDERVNPVDDWYLSAFDEACKYDQLEIIKILMEDDRVKQYVSNIPYHKLDGVVKGLLMDELEIDSEEELKIIFNMM